jgi:hypothetical protein
MAYMPSSMYQLPVPMQQEEPPKGLMQRMGQAFKGFNNPDLAMALLANSGYSPQKRSFGEIMGTSMMQAQQAQSQRKDDEFKRKYMEAQMQAMGGKSGKPIAVIGPDGKPLLVSEADSLGKQPYAGGNDAKPSALIQAYNMARDQGYSGSILEFQTELAKASAQYPYSVNDVEGVPTLTPRINTNTTSTPQPQAFTPQPLMPRPLSNLSREATAKNVLAGAGASGSEMGQSTAKAEFDLPRIESSVQTAKGDIDKLISHPGRSFITGGTSIVPIIPGTKGADADALAKQIQGQTFLQAFNMLKGGGAITETEGAKAEAAIGRMSRSQSDDAYVEALNDLKGVLDRGLEKARTQAGKGGAKPKKRYNPATGKIE